MGAEVPARTAPPLRVPFTALLNPGCAGGSDDDTRPGMEIGAIRTGNPETEKETRALTFLVIDRSDVTVACFVAAVRSVLR
jgi:hypothetical protein